jgi:hypothetical protein
MLTPIFKTSSVAAGAARKPTAALAANPFSKVLRNIVVPPDLFSCRIGASDRQAGSRCGICGRSPEALPEIGARGSLAVPCSMAKLWVSEYQGAVTSGAGAGPVS